MRTEPADLDRADLAAALADGWALAGADFEYVPEGGGSHHWRCLAGGERRFVSADDLTATFHAARDEDAAFAALGHEIGERLADHDALAARVRENRAGWVVTHGEPHGGNVIRDPAGGRHLIDWDTAMIAPRERDLQMVLDDDLTGWDEYCAVAGPVELDRDALCLYRRLWALADIASFTAVLRRPHGDTTDMRNAYRALEYYLG